MKWFVDKMHEKEQKVSEARAAFLDSLYYEE